VRKLLPFWFTLFPWGVACGAPVPEPASLGDGSANVRFEPSAASDPVSNVVHIHLANSSPHSGALSLFEGTLSSYYLGKFKHGEVPSTLASRQVPLVSWRAGAELVAAPSRPLTLGTYSLLSAVGLVAEFQVGVIRPVLERWWPPVASEEGPLFAVYCRPESSAADMPSPGPLLFEPGGSAVELASGVDESGLFADRCSHFESPLSLARGEIWIPPVTIGDWALDPAVFSVVEHQSAVSLGCEAGELALGPGCARVADDRVTVRTPNSPLFWIVHTSHGALVEVSSGGRPLTIAGLLPDAQERLWGSARDLAGAAQAFELELHTTKARGRPILNEALADALGPEPQSEWIELFNDGTLAVDLAQYSLQDGGGRTPLPHATLAPAQFALLVREDFAPNASDEPPTPGSLLIRVPTLGKSGLSNAGERLSLLDSAGAECSVLPALAGKAGQSLSRRTPASVDSDPTAFSFGVPTPGYANDALAGAP